MSATMHEETKNASAPPRFLSVARNRALLVGGIILLGVLFLFGGDQWLTVVDFTLILAIATLGLNLLSGYAGQVSLGISFFMGIGAYTAAYLGGPPPSTPFDPNGLGLTWLIWLPGAGIIAALLGALIGPTALRLRGFYLGIVSLALVFIGQYLFSNARTLTGGAPGRAVAPPGFGDFTFASPSPILGITLSTNQLYFVLTLPILALSAIFIGNIGRTRGGRALQAVRDHEVGAAIMGVNLFEAKMGAFVLSSFLAGISGAIYAAYTGYTSPEYWSLLLSIQFVAAIIVGGVATVWGSILGAVFVFALPEILVQFSLLPQSASSTALSTGDLSQIFYGLLVIGFLLFEPAGVIGLIRRIQVLMHRSESKRKGGDPASEMEATEGTSREAEHASLPGAADASPSNE